MLNNSAKRFKTVLEYKRSMLSKKERKKKIKRLPKIQYPDGIERDYFRFIKAALERITKITNDKIISNLPHWIRTHERVTQDAYDDWIEELDEEIDEMREEENIVFEENKKHFKYLLGVLAASILTFHNKQYSNQVETLTGITPFSQETWSKTMQSSWVSQNSALIKGLSDEYVKKVSFIVNNGISKGYTAEAIAKELGDLGDTITNSRAKLIARDQTSKFYSGLTKRRAEDVGVDVYIWRTVGDEKVRDTHAEMDGKYCSFSDNTVYAETLEDVLNNNWLDRNGSMVLLAPGEDFNCRCYAELVFDTITQSIDNELESNMEE